MASRKVEIDRRRFDREETKRKQDIRQKRRFYLIVCEGTKTEPNYFKGLKQNLPPGVVEFVDLAVYGIGRDPSSVVDEAYKKRQHLERNGRTIDEVWAVFDRDNFPGQNFNSGIFKGQSVGVNCAWTNESFELWYLLHFQFFQNGMSRNDYQKLIERELSQKLGRPYTYQKNSPDMFVLLQKHGNIKQAIVWAKQLETEFTGQTDYANHNPCTKMHELIEKLLFSNANGTSIP